METKKNPSWFDALFSAIFIFILFPGGTFLIAYLLFLFVGSIMTDLGLAVLILTLIIIGIIIVVISIEAYLYLFRDPLIIHKEKINSLLTQREVNNCFGLREITNKLVEIPGVYLRHEGIKLQGKYTYEYVELETCEEVYKAIMLAKKPSIFYHIFGSKDNYQKYNWILYRIKKEIFLYFLNKEQTRNKYKKEEEVKALTKKLLLGEIDKSELKGSISLSEDKNGRIALREKT